MLAYPFAFRSSVLSPLVGLVVLGALSACVAYRPEPCGSPERAVTSLAPPSEALSFEQALELVAARNPELRALRARAAGINLRPNDAALEGNLEIDDGRVDQLTFGTDVLALFGVGARPAQAALARALRSEALARHHERARELARDLAVAYSTERELADLVSHVEPLDTEAYVKAGLATAADQQESASSKAGWAAEREIVALERRRQRLAIARLIGAGPEQEATPVLPPAGWPAVPDAQAQSLLYARADLQRLATAVGVADRDLRLAVARQIPTIGLSLGATFDPTEPFQVLDVSLPLGAPAEARAAEQRRGAAVLDLEAGVLAARHEAADRRLALEESEAQLRFWQGWWEAKRALVRAARQRTATDARDLTMALHLEGEEIESARELREARLARAQARVEAAVAAGWPGPFSASGGSDAPTGCAMQAGGAR